MALEAMFHQDWADFVFKKLDVRATEVRAWDFRDVERGLSAKWVEENQNRQQSPSRRVHLAQKTFD